MNDNNTINIDFFIQDNDCIDDFDNVSEITGFNSDMYSLSSNNDVFNHMCDTENFNDLFDLPYYRKKEKYGEHEELYYETEYTVLGLIKICEYYKIDKEIKKLKYKKSDIIATIVFFESLVENHDIVVKRHKMWAYMDILSKDEHMRKYIIWN